MSIKETPKCAGDRMKRSGKKWKKITANLWKNYRWNGFNLERILIIWRMAQRTTEFFCLNAWIKFFFFFQKIRISILRDKYMNDNNNKNNRYILLNNSISFKIEYGYGVYVYLYCRVSFHSSMRFGCMRICFHCFPYITIYYICFPSYFSFSLSSWLFRSIY